MTCYQSEFSDTDGVNAKSNWRPQSIKTRFERNLEWTPTQLIQLQEYLDTLLKDCKHLHHSFVFLTFKHVSLQQSSSSFITKQKISK
jgi:hypothetical protein